MQTASLGFWTWIAKSTFYNDKNYVMIVQETQSYTAPNRMLTLLSNYYFYNAGIGIAFE